MAAISAVECAIALGFIFLVRRMKRDQTKTIEAIDVSNISLQDYAVKVDYLPKKDLTPEEIGKFFSKFGRVHMVVLGTDVGALIGKHKARADLAAKLEFVVAGVARQGAKRRPQRVARQRSTEHGEAREETRRRAKGRRGSSHERIRGVRDGRGARALRAQAPAG